MIALLQRVSMAEVWIAGKRYSRIENGILVFLGIDRNDSLDPASIDKLCHKILHLRIFADDRHQMNLNVQQVEGSILVVSQFTLCANTVNGLRPSFDTAAPPLQAEPIYQAFVACLEKKYSHVKTGVFGADMDVGLVNDGPVTFII